MTLRDTEMLCNETMRYGILHPPEKKWLAATNPTQDVTPNRATHSILTVLKAGDT